MKPFKSHLAVIALCLLALVVGWRLLRPYIALSEARVPLQAVPNAPKPAAKQDAPPASATIKQPFARTPYLGLSDPRWVERGRLRVEDPSYQWRTPIEFYGKVLDEKNQPVAGADVEIEWVGTRAVYGGDGVGHKKLASDANGLFIIKGIEGKRLGVLVSKDGYHRRSSWNNGHFEYAGFWEPEFIEPDRNIPIVFRLLRKREADPTYHIDSRVIVKAPALETHLDLLSKPVQKSTPSDLFVHITRAPDAGDYRVFGN